MRPCAHLAASIEILESVLENKQPVDRIVTDYFKKRRYAGSKDRRAITDRLFRVLRSRAKLDYLAGIAQLQANARTLCLLDGLRFSEPVETLFDGSDYGPAPLGEAEKSAAAVVAEVDLESAPECVRLEYPAWLEADLKRSLGANFDSVMTALNEEAPLDLRVNTLAGTLSDARTCLDEQKIETLPCSLSPIGLRCEKKVKLGGIQAYKTGLVDVQDEGSQLIALLSEAKGSELVMDFCAGAGGKTLAMAAEMANQGTLYALDIAAKRLFKMKPRLERANVKNVYLQPIKGALDPWLKPFENRVDRLLIDAPCSGIGAWRRSPESRWKLSHEHLQDMIARQKSILKTAAELVKPEGRLIYATCSLLKSENDDQIAAFLKENARFRLVRVQQVWDRVLSTPCPTDQETLTLRPDLHGTDGFFCAILEKT